MRLWVHYPTLRASQGRAETCEHLSTHTTKGGVNQCVCRVDTIDLILCKALFAMYLPQHYAEPHRCRQLSRM